MQTHKCTSQVLRWLKQTFLVLSLGASFNPCGADVPDTAGSTETGTAADWIQFAGNPAKTGRTNDSLTLPPLLMWKHSSKPFSMNPASALAQGDRVYFCSERYVYCLEADTGAIVWWQQVEGPIRACPALGEGLLFVPSADTRLYAFNADTGAVVWIFPTNGLLRSHLLLDEGRVVFGSDDNNVYCVKATNGELEWKFSTSGDVLSAPSTKGGFYFFLSTDGNLYCLAKEGRLTWKTPVPPGGQRNSSAVLTKDAIWVANGKWLLCFHQRTGKILHQIDIGGETVASPAADDANVYVGTKEGNLLAVDARSGRTNWKVNLGVPVLTAPTIVQDTILVGTAKGFVFALNSEGGKILWRYRVEWLTKGGNHVAAAPTVSRGSLYVVADNGAIYGFKPWGMDVGPPQATEARVKLKARDGTMVSYSLDSEALPEEVPRLRGVPPVIFSATLTDLGCGVDPRSVSLTLNDEPKELTFKVVEGIAEVDLGPKVTPGVALRPIPDGEYIIHLTAKDWQGNELSQNYKIIINNQLPPPEPVGKKTAPTEVGPVMPY